MAARASHDAANAMGRRTSASATDADQETMALTMAAIYGQVVVDDAIVARFVSERFRGRAYGASYTLGFAVSALAIPLMGYLHAQGAGFTPVLALTAACGVMLLACAVGFSLAVARR